MYDRETGEEDERSIHDDELDDIIASFGDGERDRDDRKHEDASVKCEACGAPKVEGVCECEAGYMGEADDDDVIDDPEACPGCGSRAGSGANPKCDDPMGCGFWKAFKDDAEASDQPRGRSLRDMLGSPTADGDEGVRRGFGDREGFETERGEWIENPFWDESGRDEVDPEAHYGDAFKKSPMAKRLRWGEARGSALVVESTLAWLIREIIAEMKLGVAGRGYFDFGGADERADDEVASFLLSKKSKEDEEKAIAAKAKGKKKLGFSKSKKKASTR